LYTERYAPPPGDVSAEPIAAMVPPRAQTNTTRLIWGGIGLIGLAVVVALVASVAFAGGSSATPAPLHGVRPGVTVTASLPPTVAMTLAQLNDPNFTTHVTVDSHVQVSGTITPKGQDQVVSLTWDGVLADGNQWGTLRINSTTKDTMLVTGQGYQRTLDSAKWTRYTTPLYQVLTPLFGLKTTDDLSMVGQENKDGRLLNHLQTTNWWTPDISRLAFVDLSQLRLPPDVNKLDLWVTLEGTPVSAKFSGTNMAGNTPLVDVEVTYTFTNVGVTASIKDPANWTPSPAPTPSASPIK
jgi:hypothetical protein